jgi:mannose-6-phosphate isomerase-like protein (cupin superfamily)
MPTPVSVRHLVGAIAMAAASASVLAPGAPAQVVADNTPPHATGAPHQMFVPGDLQWHDDPEFPGLKSAVLFGVVSNSAPYTYRLWAPGEDGGHVSLHSHDRTEFITVLAGTLYHTTEDGDRSSAERCEPGCFLIVPSGGSHQGWLEAGTILQIHGRGPIDARHLDGPGS